MVSRVNPHKSLEVPLVYGLRALLGRSQRSDDGVMIPGAELARSKTAFEPTELPDELPIADVDGLRHTLRRHLEARTKRTSCGWRLEHLEDRWCARHKRHEWYVRCLEVCHGTRKSTQGELPSS